MERVATVRKKDRPGGEGSSAGPQGGGAMLSIASASKGVKAGQTERRGFLSLAGFIIEVSLEKHVIGSCSSCATAVFGR